MIKIQIEALIVSVLCITLFSIVIYLIAPTSVNKTIFLGIMLGSLGTGLLTIVFSKD